jgi:LeuA allosteric (dimerisation) domain.
VRSKKFLRNIISSARNCWITRIRIPRGGQTDALTESIITWDMNGKRVQTVGIDPDQVMAAVNATLKMLNLHLMQLDQINDKNLMESAA